MLTVAIPIYNQDVRSLVQELSTQCLQANIEYEILCIDDASTQDYKMLNQEISTFKNVIYQELAQNIGRSKIRNLLAKKAKHPTILFLDCDSKIINPLFIQKYLNQSRHLIISGGRIYSDERPLDQNKILHWKYGKTIESKSARQRLKSPYLYFHSNNFIISKELFTTIQFDEAMSSYGYEDLQFAKMLEERAIDIHHIDNPVQHEQLDDYEAFLNKSKNGIHNLAVLYVNQNAPQTRLIKFYNTLSSFGGLSLTKYLWKLSSKYCYSSLSSNRPIMFIFQFLKLNQFIQEVKLLQKTS